MEDVIINARLNGTQFLYYTDEEVKKLSSKLITSSEAFETLFPKQGGLHDPAMGPSPYTHNSE